MKKNILLALIASVIGIVLWLSFQIYDNVTTKKAVELKQKNLPHVRLVDLDSSTFILNVGDKPTLIFYFDPSCDHCQAEAKELIEQRSQFENINIYWLSSQPLNLLRQFEQQYGLQKNIQSLKIAKINIEDTHQQFGIKVVPTILIYDNKGQLVKKYLGETKIEATLKYLKPPLNSTLLNHFKTITYVRNYTTKPCIATR